MSSYGFFPVVLGPLPHSLDQIGPIPWGPGTEDQAAVLAQAAASTARAAQWVREVTGGQTQPEHATVLEDFAAAVARTGIDLDPADAYLGGVNWETRYRLDGYVLLGARRTDQPIRLTTTEALVIGAVGALVLALPAAAMFDTADLPRLCAVLDHATATADTSVLSL